MGEGRNVYRFLMGKPERKRPLERRRRRWECGIEMDLREIGLGGWGDVEWIHLGDSGDLWWVLMNAVMKFGFWHHGINYLINY
jgi:hypothetical protein